MDLWDTCLVGNAQFMQTSLGLQGARAGSGVHAGPQSCRLHAWSWGLRVASACAEMATACGYMHILGFASLPAGTVQGFLPALAAHPSTCNLQAAVVAACAMLAWHTDHHSTLCRTLQTPRPPPSWEKGLQGMVRVAELSQLCQAICMGACWG